MFEIWGFGGFVFRVGGWYVAVDVRVNVTLVSLSDLGEEKSSREAFWRGLEDNNRVVRKGTMDTL